MNFRFKKKIISLFSFTVSAICRILSHYNFEYKLYFKFLDVSDIKYVINYDYPNNMEDYIHRIGRTGRHNATGTSHAFFTEEDASKAKDLISVLRDANQNVVPELEMLARSSYKPKKCMFSSVFNFLVIF